MDNLVMSYNGNQLLQVDNDSDDGELFHGVRYSGGNLLTYDENGCLTKDMDKNISSIQYNSLNLPTNMRLSIASARISYIYDSRGNKLQETRISMRPKSRHETSYCGNFIFENGMLKRILVEGGFIYFGENDTTYHYFLKDHLGSIRAVVNQETGQVVEKYDYYPFGKQHGDYHTGYIHPYRYNGKELDNAMGIDWLYYGARMMEPEWGRFTTPDPLAEKYYSISPYAYCAGDPINKIDPDGREIVISGNRQQRHEVLKYMQSLTNDKLGVRADGQVIIMSTNTRNKNRNLAVGTGLISSMISNEHTATISLGETNSKHNKYRRDASNGKGTDVDISFNPSKEVSVLTKDVQTGKSAYQGEPQKFCRFD